jgi:hypothetical protein
MLKKIRFGPVVVAAVAASLAGSSLVPASAAADTVVEVRIEGAGSVVETSGAHRVNCSKSWDEQDRSCGTFGWPGWWWVELKAEPAPGWHFAGWDNQGAYLWCNNTNRTCGFTSDLNRSEATLTARFAGNDADSDGFPLPADCNDGNRDIHPGANDIPGNGIDENCDKQDAASPPDLDYDNDDYDRKGGRLPEDCDDSRAGINPGAPELPDNGLDDDCKGGDAVSFDRDHDGYDRREDGAKAPFDCDDGNARINPGVADLPEDGVDQDCDGRDAVNLDRDRDGYQRDEPGATAPFDCDDAKAWVHPNAADTPDNSVDENCDGRDVVVLDRDGDGYDRNEPGAKAPFDCDDAKAAMNPGAVDAPRNKIDEDCDGHDADYPSITSEVRYAAHRKGGKARIRRLSVIRPPDGATVTVRCRGKGCTFKRRRQVAAPGTSELSFAADLRKAKLRRGAVVEVWITRSGMRGKVVRLRVGRGAKMSAQTLCVEPGSKKPGGCPAG